MIKLKDLLFETPRRVGSKKSQKSPTPKHSEIVEINGKEYSFEIYQRRRTGSFEAFVSQLNPTDGGDGIFEFATNFKDAMKLKDYLIKNATHNQ